MRSRLAAVALAAATTAHAQPSLTQDGCAFDDDALVRALAQERADRAAIHLTCRSDGTAIVTVTDDTGARTRDVDLRDVPAELTPRVIALVVATIASERPAPPPPPVVIAPPSTPIAAPRDEPPFVGPPLRASLVFAGDRRLAVVGRALLRRHGDLTMAGGGAAVARGAYAVGLHAAASRVEHRLGDVTAWQFGADVSVAIACSSARPIVCLSARGELDRQAVSASASAPGVAATDLAAVAVRADAEVSLALPVAGLEVGAAVAVGVGSGLVARANASPLLDLSGWTVGGALEVRR